MAEFPLVLPEFPQPASRPSALSALPSQPSNLHIRAASDTEAVMQWLEEYRASPQTLRSYRREAERLLLWLHAQKMVLADMNREVLSHFEGFLSDPQPRSQWVGPSRPRPHSEWRPFRGSLGAASRRQSLVILQGLFSWLVEAGWLAHNPFRLMRDKARRLNNQAPGIERYLERELWQWLWQWLNEPLLEQATPRERYQQARRVFLFGFAYLLAPRISEMANARMQDFQRTEGRWWWHVVGKGAKTARIPVPDDMLYFLKHWRAALGLAPFPEHDDDTPLLRALDGRREVGENQLYRVIRATFQQAAQALEDVEGERRHIEALRRATPHWLRHTAITHQAQSGVELRYLAESARHSRLDTTARYLHTEDEEWHRQLTSHTLSHQ
ncbi:tyrosine-type recombinase/integrase [Halomonas sp. ZH2S]|uniref:Tyrosine-type recombinase/integrase n=1 Tax=Vreelandella zhuhanensis TaxID=2684210 RepID=A0A7X3KQ74_9GAMM|nr:tyrosine-type recombinase/integrase [Halomonas zhuhanensis]